MTDFVLSYAIKRSEKETRKFEEPYATEEEVLFRLNEFDQSPGVYLDVKVDPPLGG